MMSDQKSFCPNQEYAKLHDRYTDLFKTHMDYMERTKLLLSTASERSEVRGRLGLNPVGRSSGKCSIFLPFSNEDYYVRPEAYRGLM